MKKYFKEMSTEEKVNIIMNNDELRRKAEEHYYTDLMEQQAENGELMLGKEHWRYIDVRDNYSSFYLVLKDWNKFLDNLDKDYLSQKGIDLYNEIYKLYEEYNNTDMYSDRFNELEEILEDKCKELLKICEEQLHQYETYTDEDLKEDITFLLEENNFFGNLNILLQKKLGHTVFCLYLCT